ncbi:hypothetical protein H696_03049 [Fonticula alba]|uniref:AP complex subunit sigma n=1 Tax=Fonticula alba TaxID=691883 RepID=A0A058Z9B1_FONAL|nr:hypothetical protein H696_03049 [Fonticula alba]KCV70696.1 hypothetical protein H696_03049 [Fonticula alba]|eukprot:XP_009495212.1 hypothetical protein H696_03049 [Fonticula alba]
MMQFFLLINRQGKVRLAKWFVPTPTSEKNKIAREVAQLVLSRRNKMCNFIDWKDRKIVYRRYASLYFITTVDNDDNELYALEAIHQYVEVLDRYFGNVCELDLIFNFHKAYFVLDEVLLGGELQESSKKAILKSVAQQDNLMESPEHAPISEI